MSWGEVQREPETDMLELLMYLLASIAEPIFRGVSHARREPPRDDMRVLGDINPGPRV